MKALQRANIHAFLSALVWGTAASFAIRFFISSWISPRMLAMLQYGSVFLYPVFLLTWVRRKTGLWLNLGFFSLVGGTASFLIWNLIGGAQNQGWMNFVFLIIFFAVVLYSIPKIELALQHDWKSPVWDKFNRSSLAAFLFLRFPWLDDITD